MTGPRQDGPWCCMCGVWRTDDNGLERCPVSHLQMTEMGANGLSHLWAYSSHPRAMKIWDSDARFREQLAQGAVP